MINIQEVVVQSFDRVGLRLSGSAGSRDRLPVRRIRGLYVAVSARRVMALVRSGVSWRVTGGSDPT